MLKEYRESLIRFDQLKGEIENIRRQIKVEDGRISDAVTKFKQLNQDQQTTYSKELSTEKERLIKGCEPLLYETHDLTNQIEVLREEIENAEGKVDWQQFEANNKDLLFTLKKLRPIIEYIVSSFPEIELGRVYSAEEALRSLHNIAVKTGRKKYPPPIRTAVDDLFNYESEQADGGAYGIARFALQSILLLPESLDIKVIYKYGLYVIYLAGLTLVIVNAAFLFIPAIGAGISYVYSSTKTKQKFNGISEKLSNFISKYSTLEDLEASLRKEYEETSIEEFKETKQAEIKELEAEIDEIKSQYATAVKAVKVDPEVVKNRVREDFAKQSKQIELLKAKSSNIVEDYKKDLENKSSQLTELHRRIQSLKDGIMDSYMGLRSIGTSKQMISDYILGFNDNNIISIQHKDKPMNFFFTGNNSEKNSYIINMLIAQCLGNVQPNVLRFTVVDKEYSCNAYGVYMQDNLKDMFEFITVEADITELIARTQEELTVRNATISAIADNISDYNKQMLAQDSLTMDYHLIFFQKGSLSLVTNELFLQICRSGPTYGIFPVVFIPQSVFDEAMHDTSSKKNEAFISYLEVVKETCWSYSHETKDINELTADYLGLTNQRL